MPDLLAKLYAIEDTPDDFNGFSDKIINENLKRFRATYLPATNFLRSRVKFESDSDLVVFRIMYG